MINGMINVYKEKGYTSHDVVAKLRGILGQRKIGHTGTLDPDAIGVLPVCLGKATKLCDMLTEKDKTYKAVLLLGKTTDTQDISGKVLETKDISILSEEDVKECVLSFVGKYDQLPPMYSALKVNGKKLYELAREGIEIERKKRTVQIYDIEILDIDLPRVIMNVTCSKGTYIRTLCYDIGQQLQVGGCMEHLTRTRVSSFDIKESKTLSQIQEWKEQGRLTELVIPIDNAFSDMPAVYLNERGFFLASNGNRFSIREIEKMDTISKDEKVRVYYQREFMAVYNYKKEQQIFQIEKMFYEKSS